PIGRNQDQAERSRLESGLSAQGAYCRKLNAIALILQVDVATGALVDAYQYSSNVHACIHGLAILNDTAFQAGA
ncbi:hypothetical protein, partial [Salinibacter ruber]|uniref:hypothetical protein n=1 Tax=Salinibacter ruber TaxID=146919 RepID=UPI001CA53F0D